MKNRSFLTFILALFAAVCAFAQDVNLDSIYSQSFVKVKVKAVRDGDSYNVEFANGKKEWVRLVGVDAPEKFWPGHCLKAQPFSKESGDSIRLLIKGKTVWLDTTATKKSRDHYGRLLAEVYYGDIFLPLYIVEKGWAWAAQTSDRKNPKINRLLKDAQAEAREAEVGLFNKKYKRPLRPDTWRDKYKGA